MRFLPLVFAALMLCLPSGSANAELFNTKKEAQETPEETLKVDESGNGVQPTEPDASPAPEKKKPKQVFVQKEAKNKALNPEEINRIIIMHTQEIGAYCVGAWQNQKCMSALSSSTLTMASLYAEALEKSGHKDAQDPLMQNCAAATAATKVEVPAYAMKSAMTTCANAIYDITESTKIKPNLTHFQLLVEPIFCLGGDERCGKFEELLRTVVAKSPPPPAQ